MKGEGKGSNDSIFSIYDIYDIWDLRRRTTQIKKRSSTINIRLREILQMGMSNRTTRDTSDSAMFLITDSDPSFYTCHKSNCYSKYCRCKMGEQVSK